MNMKGAAGSGVGAAMEVRQLDGSWRPGRLVERMAGKEPRWRVQFYDGGLMDDVQLANPEVHPKPRGEKSRCTLVSPSTLAPKCSRTPALLVAPPATSTPPLPPQRLGFYGHRCETCQSPGAPLPA
jgi:hypothetical protein